MSAVLSGIWIDWPIESLLLFLVLALLAEILGTIGGFGSSIFFVPIAAMFMEFHEVLGLTALFHVASNLSKIVLFRKGFDKRLILLLGIPAVVAVVIGAYVTKLLDTQVLEHYLGWFLIALSLFFLFRPKYRIKQTSANAITGGILSGGLAGLVGTGGAIRGLTLTAFGLPKEVFIATSAIIDMGVDTSRAIVYTSNGFVNETSIKLLPFLIIIGFVGTYIGKAILKKVPQSRFEKIVLLMILVIGVKTVWF